MVIFSNMLFCDDILKILKFVFKTKHGRMEDFKSSTRLKLGALTPNLLAAVAMNSSAFVCLVWFA